VTRRLTRVLLAFGVVAAAVFIGGVSNPQVFSMLLRAVIGTV